MINWFFLLTNSIWVCSLSVILAVTSICYSDSRSTGTKLSDLFNQTRYTIPLLISGITLCLGMILRSQHWYEAIFWCVCLGVMGLLASRIKKTD